MPDLAIRAWHEFKPSSVISLFNLSALKPPVGVLLPYVRLVSPEGDTWEFNDPSDENCITGEAVEFCHVVTQGRNIADVNLKVVGEPARLWMNIAQCFAGPPEDPPAPGSRTANF